MRQNTRRQEEENEGSATYRRDQADFPREWGWPPEAIEVIDEDQGKSGSSTIHRRGYQRMLVRHGKAVSPPPAGLCVA